MTTLYTKQGRRYIPWGHVESWHRDGDVMKVGTFRLVYCPENGSRRYTDAIIPDTAAFLAAAAIAKFAMEQAILEKAKASPQVTEAYTPEQLAIIEKFRQDMAATGALIPSYWTHSTAWEIAQAGIDAVKDHCRPELMEDALAFMDEYSDELSALATQ